ncbi:peptide-methionine (S)-S-oxide reductase [Salinihabitans flavidus]|uniref:Peptide methionine sulfoxide reductase MsrA n=1 Tax=Salinihabitans flavidus TaxID=569882 RepID=A0A1H8LXU0_9RHOB|nr:peptide-methionine (S)-S-oxide reductase MsrA [Salinihabitans flavidus]SEO09927.1 peptide-methionine (S)-S-oxide reductase [Salinihabitans flavidus]
MRILQTIKLAALALLIGVGFSVKEARAAESESIVVAGGCFWCVEADFERVRGVRDAVSGYTGGTVEDPTYKQVTGGDTGHYEAVKITFDPATISRKQILDMFFRSIDPTDAGGQFCDRGDSYRTAIFVSDSAEREVAQAAKQRAEAELGQTIVTPILEAAPFYEAEDYHQDYYKGTKLVLTRFGPKRQAEAYKRYRDACGRDERVRQLWGDAAPFAGS